MKPEETVDYNIKVAWHAISRMYNTQAAQNDITTSIGFVLLNIDQERLGNRRRGRRLRRDDLETQ